ncbi:MAG: thioesterase [Pirellulaceae bacterium]|nr:thioesterase [Pirellulaceae bacterium]
MTDFVPQLRTILHPSDTPVADVYWITHAGGGTNTLAHRVRVISPKTSLWLSAPTMPAREEFLELVFDGDLCQMADSLSEQIAQHHQQPERGSLPLVMIGHSFGSVLAYETTRRLISRGLIPHRLTVLSFPAADRMSYDKQLHTLDDQELISEVDEMFGGVPENIRDDPAALKFFVPALRFDLGMLERYEHNETGQVIDVPITAICGTDDRAVDLADMQRWSLMTESTFRLRSMPGDHFFPLERMAEVLEVATWDALPG